ncbi:GNAT family N-acetyltransferase [Pseudofulvibacter geojedonensis]|uniref:GNAT family N-acetyltransferase n=1 Tax=Pseudofulvibacter geojedonensis TaxID=1123758 RepID=A0ABW3I1C7_9FLAO
MQTIKLTLKTYDAFNRISQLEIDRVANFLFKHLEKYGDSSTAIRKAIEYSAKERTGLGGYVFTIEDGPNIIAACVVNKTGMDEYIPENILVYIATHNEYRGKGIGKKLMTYVIENTKGDIALHVEKDNPAKFLYEKLGFTNPYLEMRLTR